LKFTPEKYGGFPQGFWATNLRKYAERTEVGIPLDFRSKQRI
jgi:hypothetical protein